MAVRQYLPALMACIATVAGAGLCEAGDSTLPASQTSYDRSFPLVAYSRAADSNAVAAFMNNLQRGAVTLQYAAPRGYLDSLLEALDIPASSQLLVFSRTSLQAPFISSTTPRAIYFNDHTYVAWVQGSEYLEILTIDGDRGPVFFSVRNSPGKPIEFHRETVRCLACHDSASMRQGGVPRVMVLSSSVEAQINPAGRYAPIEVTPATALEDRWGGWFVTGRLGTQLHLGNLPLAGPPDPTVRRIHNRSNLDGLQGYFDTAPYLTDKSDIVAFLVLEHQAHVQNLVTRVRFESAADAGAARQWSDLPSARKDALKGHLDHLVRALTFQDERRLLGRIRGGAGFEAAFHQRGPRDAQGRSLREFDLLTRTFRFAVSYTIYSGQFDALPDSAKDYVYRQIATYLNSPSSEVAATDMSATMEILIETRPGFAAAL